MTGKITDTVFQHIDWLCDEIGGNSLKQTVLATTGLIVSGVVTYTITPILLSDNCISSVALVVNLICVATLLKNAFQWRNILIYLAGVAILSTFGIRWCPKVTDQLFEEKQYKDYARLKYEEDSNKTLHPTVTIYTQDPFKKGKALGMLTAPQTIFDYDKIFRPLMTFAQLFSGDTTGKWLDRKLEQYTIPEEYLLEMKGLCAGVNKWCRKNNNPYRLSLDTVKRIHCLSDTYKMGKIGLFNLDIVKYLWNTVVGDMGCSTVVLKRDNQMVVGRNMDWPGMKMGRYAFIRRDLMPDGAIIQSHIYPGVIAFATAVKIYKGRLCFAAIVNECPLASMNEGIPCGLWVRRCVEQCSTVEDVQRFITCYDRVASSFHLIVADGINARNYQMHPRKDEYYLERDFCDSGNLIITNHFVDPATQRILDDVPPVGTSAPRFAAIVKQLDKGASAIEEIDSEARKSLLSANCAYTLSSHLYKFGPVEEGIRIAICDAWAALKL